MATKSTTWAATMRSATPRDDGFVSASSRPFRFFHPEPPSASRRSLRCHDALVTG